MAFEAGAVDYVHEAEIHWAVLASVSCAALSRQTEKMRE